MVSFLLILGGVLAVIAFVAFCVRTSFRETIVYAEGPDLFDALELEVERARRFNEPLSVIEIETGADDVQVLSTQMRQELRAVDLTTVRGNSVYVILEGSGAEGASKTLQRLERTSIVKPSEHIVRGATFPDDASTLGGLLAVLGNNTRVLEGSSDPDANAEPVDESRRLDIAYFDDRRDEQRAAG